MAMATLALLPAQSLPLKNKPQLKTKTQFKHRSSGNVETNTIISIALTHQQNPHNKSMSTMNADFNSLCKDGRLKEALGYLQVMDERGLAADDTMYVSLLDACGSAKALAEGKKVHAHMLANGFQQNVFLATRTVDMYSKCGSLADACLVFCEIAIPNIFLWNSMIRACVTNGSFEQALIFYRQVQQAEVQPDKFTFTSVLKACASISDLEMGREIHNHIIRSGIEADYYLDSSLLIMYAKSGNVEIARHLFDRMPRRNLISWNAMIASYVRSGHGDEVLRLFSQMQLAGEKPDSVTVVSIVRVCSDLAALRQGKEIHGYIVKTGFESDLFVGSSLIDMYNKCDKVTCARHLFDKMPERDVVSWNAMMAGYVNNLHFNEVFELFSQMQVAGLKPDSFTIVSVLQACSHSGSMGYGKGIHGHIIKSDFASNGFVGSALVKMYAKCGNVEVARQLFDQMFQRDMISWNAMIAANAENDHPNEALRLFSQMQLAGIIPDSITIASVLPACVSLGTVEQGKEIHGYIIKSGLESDAFVMSALIDMYCKCGSVDIGQRVFDKMSIRDVVVWNTIIAGYGMHGHGRHALKLFYQMQQEGLKPVHVTFISVLSACSHAGLVDEGWKCFDQMTRVYHIKPELEHYSCMVDLLGRAGHLDKAHEFIKMMPLEPDAGVWGPLLGACRIHGNIELGEHVAERLFELDPETPGYYVLLSNIYAINNRWDGVAKVRKLMKSRGVKKKRGISWITIKNRVHEFIAGDRSHPHSKKIYAVLEILAGQMEDIGYVLDKNFVLEEEDD